MNYSNRSLAGMILLVLGYTSGSGEIFAFAVLLIGLYFVLVPLWKKFRYLELDAKINGVLPISGNPILEYTYENETFRHYFEPRYNEIDGDTVAVYINPSEPTKYHYNLGGDEFKIAAVLFCIAAFVYHSSDKIIFDHSPLF